MDLLKLFLHFRNSLNKNIQNEPNTIDNSSTKLMVLPNYNVIHKCFVASIIVKQTILKIFVLLSKH